MGYFVYEFKVDKICLDRLFWFLKYGRKDFFFFDEYVEDFFEWRDLSY